MENNQYDEEALLGGGLCLNNLGNYDSALELFDKLLSQDPEESNALKGKLTAHIKFAEQLTAKNQFDESLDNYKIALNMESSNKEALLGKGLVLIKLDKFKEALDILNIYIKISCNQWYRS